MGDIILDIMHVSRTGIHRDFGVVRGDKPENKAHD